jgi:hypothetical protein
MARARLAAGAARGVFAHLLGAGAGSPRAEEKEDKDPKDQNDPKGEAKEDCPECDGTGEAEDGETCESCDGTGERDGKRSKKAKAEEDEEAEEEDDDDEAIRKACRAGRSFERMRCAAIFAAKSAGARPDVAAHLAFTTKMSAKAAIALMDATVSGGAAPTAGRAPRPRVVIGSDGGPGPADPASPQGMAAKILAAGKKARGEA